MATSPGASPTGSLRGHRAIPHTADVVVEAWAPTRTGCFEEAVAALVDTFAETDGAGPAGERLVAIGPADDPELLVALLEEVVFLADTEGLVPVTTVLTERGDGGLTGAFTVVPVDEVEVVGAPPKAISRHDLVVDHADRRWSCRFTVDV